MRKSKFIIVLAVLVFINGVFAALSFFPYSEVVPAYKSQTFELSKEQQIEKGKNAEKLLQLEIEQKIAALEK